MPHCPQCGRLVSLLRGDCPECSGELRVEPSGSQSVTSSAVELADRQASLEPAPSAARVTERPRQKMVARFANCAEAGYFADELAAELDIDVEIVPIEDFHSIRGTWTTQFALHVAEADAVAAARFLQNLVDRTTDDSPPDSDTDRERLIGAAHGAPPAAAWLPLVLTLAAGSLVYWGLVRAEQRPRPPVIVRGPHAAKGPPELWRMLSRSSEPWVQPAGPQQPARRLEFDPQGRTALLREDTDGNGTFDREQRFTW
jgi:hypothetical protein